jgi:hypothetical protein
MNDRTYIFVIIWVLRTQIITKIHPAFPMASEGAL